MWWNLKFRADSVGIIADSEIGTVIQAADLRAETQAERVEERVASVSVDQLDGTISHAECGLSTISKMELVEEDRRR